MRIAIVNDLALAREALRLVVGSVPAHKVAWTAADGAEALEMTKVDRPDLILMDLVMPRVDGVEATRRIMAETPCPILVVTSSVGGNIAKVYEAMGLGALDAVNTPVLGPGGKLEGAADLLRKIDQLSRLAADPKGGAVGGPVAMAPRPSAMFRTPLVALGASTGGPKALAEILSALPRDLNACVMIVQHVDEAFASGLARWLSDLSALPVELIEPGREPIPGRVLLARTNDHLVLSPDRRLRYDPEPAAHCYRPSVDVFFHSLARSWPEPGVAALLTGMGRDGAQGLTALRKAGWHTIAQDRDTSVIWGMPRAAVEAGAAAEVLPPRQIAESIASRVAARARPAASSPRSRP